MGMESTTTLAGARDASGMSESFFYLRVQNGTAATLPPRRDDELHHSTTKRQRQPRRRWPFPSPSSPMETMTK